MKKYTLYMRAKGMNGWVTVCETVMARTEQSAVNKAKRLCGKDSYCLYLECE